MQRREFRGTEAGDANGASSAARNTQICVEPPACYLNRDRVKKERARQGVNEEVGRLC